MKTQFYSFLIYDDLDIENFFSELVVENPNKKGKSTTVQLHICIKQEIEDLNVLKGVLIIRF